MSSAHHDFSAQRSLLAAKIAAMGAAAAAADAALARAQRDCAEAMRAHFAVEAPPLRARKDVMDRDQMAAGSLTLDSWWLFHGDDIDLAIGLDRRLVIAAADLALCKRLTPYDGAAPTAVDRSIAAAFARRLRSVAADESAAAADGAPELASTDIRAALSRSGVARWCQLSFSGRFSGDAVDFVLCIARPDRPGEVVADHSVSANARPHNQTVRRISVVAHCVGGFMVTPIHRALSLKPGDVVPVDWTGDGKAQLMIGARCLGTGTLGHENGRRAFRFAGS